MTRTRVAGPAARMRALVAEIAALQANGIHVVDTLDPLILRGASERQFFWLDIHLTPAGNATLADEALPLLEALAIADTGEPAGASASDGR